MPRRNRNRPLYKLIVLLGLALGLLAARTAHAAEIIHVVGPGENLFRIGLRYGVDWRDIMAANGLYSTNIYVGEALVIPGAAGGEAPPAAAPAAAPSPAPAPAAGPAGGGSYIIQRGDTLWQIAQRFGVTVPALMSANGIADPGRIYYGLELAIPGAGSAANEGAESTSRYLPVVGQAQTWALSCEARSAVDWAGYLDTYIGEADFQGSLPVSDDPDAGFVGEAWGLRGQIPPAAYGVHADPVAALLRAFGVGARAEHGLSWDAVQAQIDAGKPVIVWVVGEVWNGTGVEYTAASDGHTTVVVPYEHTVMVIGYGPGTVTVLDGARAYSSSLGQFMASWGVLGNMAVVAQ
jgi:LysM repeat protein